MKIINVLVLKIFFLFLFFSVHTAQTESSLCLMPAPKEVKLNYGKFRITKDFRLGVTGNPDSRIYSAATRFLKRLDNRTALFFSQDFITNENNFNLSTLVIHSEKPGLVKLGEDESYKIIVDSLQIRITAPNDIGAMYGLETLLQLLNVDEKGYYFPAIEIKDEPCFKWRGLMIDVSRHFMHADVIKRNLDAMAAIKMNVFHWHLSDDQGFRIECKTFPKLHELGSDGFYFTQEEVKAIIKYAGDRGIRVIPEFDIPGHATAWFVGYPEYASAPGPYQIERSFGIMNPTFNPVKEETYQFFDKFFEEMCALFPDVYFHIGGDENNGKHWNENEEIQLFKTKNRIKDNHELQAYFNNRVQTILKKYGKSMIGWDEILHPGIPNDIVIQSWRGKESLINSAKQGYQGILSNGYYIDLMQKTSFHYLNDPIDDNSGLTQEEEARILGGEATMWSELITDENIDSRIWPRTAAIAERFWSPKEIRNLDGMHKRLERINFLLEEHGLKHISFQEKYIRRLTNNENTVPLKILLDVTAPLEGYERYKAARQEGFSYKQHSPYSRFSDAAIADPVMARKFNDLVEKYLFTKDQALEESIKSYLNVWKENHQHVIRLAEASPMLKEILILSENLSKSSAICLEAMEMINKKNTAPISWKTNAKSVLNETRKSYGQVEIIIVDSLQKIVELL